MKRSFLLAITLLFIVNIKAQQDDFIVVKKNGQTFRTFFSGGRITFQTKTGDWIDGKLTDIRNDSLFFRELVVRQVPTPWGVPRLDTLTSYLRKVCYRDIFAIPKKRESFSYVKNGSLFMLGGGGYIFLNVVNSAYLHYAVLGRKNLPGLLTAAGCLGVGIVLNKLHKSFFTIGKRYTIDYIKI